MDFTGKSQHTFVFKIVVMKTTDKIDLNATNWLIDSFNYKGEYYAVFTKRAV